MAVASGPAGPVLAGPVFTVIFGTAHAQIMSNEWGGSYNFVVDARVYATATATDSITDSTAQDNMNATMYREAGARRLLLL